MIYILITFTEIKEGCTPKTQAYVCVCVCKRTNICVFVRVCLC